MSSRLMTILFCVLLVGVAAEAQAAGRTDVVRELAGRVGPIIGSASACQDIARLRIEFILEKFTAVIRESASGDAERDDLSRLLDRNIADGRLAVTAGRTDCRTAARQLADLEQSLKAPASQAAVEPTLAAVPPAPTATLPTAAAPNAAPSGSPIRGISDQEVRFGMAAPFSGAAKELGGR